MRQQKLRLQRSIFGIYNKIAYFSFYLSDDRPLADIFTVLPSKKDLPDYYQVIKQPVDIKKIKVSA